MTQPIPQKHEVTVYDRFNHPHKTTVIHGSLLSAWIAGVTLLERRLIRLGLPLHMTREAVVVNLHTGRMAAL